jgi:hypothetical protein
MDILTLYVQAVGRWFSAVQAKTIYYKTVPREGLMAYKVLNSCSEVKNIEFQ